MQKSMQRLPSKVSPPLLGDVYPRHRLFGRLLALERYPALWVTGPAGAGKTTLVNSYLAGKGTPYLWFQCDAGDGDPATFFYYLRRAAEPVLPETSSLPLLGPEYQQALPTFARRFFETLFGAMPEGTCLVIDDVHEMYAAPVRDLLPIAIRAAFGSARLVLVSRRPPPPECGALKLEGHLAEIEGRDLLLNLEETSGVLHAGDQKMLEPDNVREIHAHAGGWAAGTLLLAAHLGQEGATALDKDLLLSEDLFDYFAAEVFDRLEEPYPRFLLETAVFPAFTPAMANALTQRLDAVAILSHLQRHHLFLEVHGEDFQYHPLFRRFLLARTRAAFPLERLASLRRRAADLLEGAERPEAAAPLLIEAGDLDGLVGLLARHAPRLTVEGRHHLLGQWLEGLPSGLRAERPWLEYWRGVATLFSKPGRSREAFAAALQSFETQGDSGGALLSWAGAVDSFGFEWHDFTPLDGWIDRLPASDPAELRNLPPGIEGRVTAAMAFACMVRRPHHAGTRQWVEAAVTVARACAEPPLKLQIFTQAITYHFWLGEIEAGRILLEEIRHLAAREDPSSNPALTLRWLEAAFELWRGTDPEVPGGQLAQILADATDCGILIWHPMLFSLAAYGALAQGDVAAGGRFLGQLEGILDPMRRHTVSQFHYLSAWLAFLRNDLATARVHSEVALRVAEETGYLFPELLCRLAKGRILYRSGERSEALQQFVEVRGTAEACGSALFHCAALLEEALCAIEAGERPKGEESLRRAFRLGRLYGFSAPLWWWDPRTMARLCSEALASGIETQFVGEIVRRRRLEPPAEAPEVWPWPVRIHTLGTFCLELEDHPLAFTGKAKKKPLELLKALVAFGGRSISEERLSGALWPDADGDQAHRAFATTLHRLRQILGREKALQLCEGKLSIDPVYCRVDADVFEDACRRAREAEEGGAPPAIVAEHLKAALNLYHGPFLPQEPEDSYILPRRERLRGLFLRAVHVLGRLRMADGEEEAALALFEKGVEIEPAAEDLYRGIIACHLAAGRLASAISAYRRCEEMLLSLLGAAPSSATTALLRQGSAVDRNAIETSPAN